jgi:prepilin-type N-terminal cleavage/methylation domain-containing protein
MKKNSKLISRQGFSLMETMVTMLIFSFVAGALYAAAAIGEVSWQANKVRVEVSQELRKAMGWMEYELQQAGDSSIVDVPADGAWYTTMTFKIPDGVENGDIHWGENTIQFILSGTDLHRIEAGTDKTLAQNIVSLQFRRQAASANILEVALQSQKNTVKGETLTADLNFEVQLRN